MLPERHHPAIRILHWLIAALVLAALVMSILVMPKIPNTDPEKATALFRHMSTGGLISVFAVFRLFIRRKTKRPASLPSGMAWADRLAAMIHPMLDGLVLVMIGSGIGMAVISDLPAIIFGANGKMPTDFNVLPLHTLHAFTARALIGALFLHIGGALYHQLILGDGLLSRMWIWRRKRPSRQAC